MTVDPKENRAFAGTPESRRGPALTRPPEASRLATGRGVEIGVGVSLTPLTGRPCQAADVQTRHCLHLRGVAVLSKSPIGAPGCLLSAACDPTLGLGAAAPCWVQRVLKIKSVGAGLSVSTQGVGSGWRNPAPHGLRAQPESA